MIAQTPCCTEKEVHAAIQSAKKAFPAWSQTPVMKRAQVVFRFRELLEKHLDELTRMVATENGKVWDEARGDILKVKEPIELACGVPTMMMGESLMDTSTGYDTVLYREPVECLPASPLSISRHDSHGLDDASVHRLRQHDGHQGGFHDADDLDALPELWQEAGLPEGVLNVVTCSRNEAESFLTHPDVRGITFVGSTSVGLHVYATAAAHGKRVQALSEAKNHGLVLEDAARADCTRHHQLLVRLRRRAVHGAAGDRREESDRRPVGGTSHPVRARAHHWPRL